MPQFKPIFLILFVGALSIGAGSVIWNILHPPVEYSDSTVLAVYPEPRVLADFELAGPGGASWSLQQLRGHWTLVFFGYTHCPDICPGTLMQLAQLRKSMAASMEENTLPRVLFISVDPGRDTPERLADYVRFFDSSFVGITGPDAQIAALSLQMGIAYFIDEHDAGTDSYEVAHSTGILLLNPQARLVGAFPAPHDISQMQTALLQHMDDGSG